MEHDKCRRTSKFPTAGQNLSGGASKPDYKDDKEAIKEAIKGWYDEYKNVNDLNDVKKFEGENLMKMGHWSQLVWSYANRIGCSLIKYEDDEGWKNSLIGCNYSSGNMMGSPIYKIGDAASDCKSGKDEKYEGLCSTDEDYSQHDDGSTFVDKDAKPSPVVEQWVNDGKKFDL